MVCIFQTHFLKFKNSFSRSLFRKILPLCMVSIPKRFLIKIGYDSVHMVCVCSTWQSHHMTHDGHVIWNTSTFSSVTYVITYTMSSFGKQQCYFYLLFGTKQTHGVDHDHISLGKKWGSYLGPSGDFAIPKLLRCCCPVIMWLSCGTQCCYTCAF